MLPKLIFRVISSIFVSSFFFIEANLGPIKMMKTLRSGKMEEQIEVI